MAYGLNEDGLIAGLRRALHGEPADEHVPGRAPGTAHPDAQRARDLQRAQHAAQREAWRTRAVDRTPRHHGNGTGEMTASQTSAPDSGRTFTPRSRSALAQTILAALHNQPARTTETKDNDR